MQDKINDGEAQINAILDITDNNLFQAMLLVCNDIQIDTHNTFSCGWYDNDKWLVLS